MPSGWTGYRACWVLRVSLPLRIKLPFTALQILNCFWKHAEQRGGGGDGHTPPPPPTQAQCTKRGTKILRVEGDYRAQHSHILYILSSSSVMSCLVHVRTTRQRTSSAARRRVRQELRAGRGECQTATGSTNPRTQERHARCSLLCISGFYLTSINDSPVASHRGSTLKLFPHFRKTKQSKTTASSSALLGKNTF